LEGELTFQVDDGLVTKGTGELVFVPGGVVHAFTNRGEVPARLLIACAPAGFERHFARRAAEAAGIAPPAWAMLPLPPVTKVGPPIGG
jgi:mannose-6-phosphate isomerase-like protein (cupin superfamily)